MSTPLTLQQAGRLLGLSEMDVLGAVAEGELPHQKGLKVAVEDLLRWAGRAHPDQLLELQECSQPLQAALREGRLEGVPRGAGWVVGREAYRVWVEQGGLVSLWQAVPRYRVGPVVLQRAIAAGELTLQREGDRRLLRVAELEEWSRRRESGWMTRAQVAQQTGLTKSQVLQEIRAGRLKAEREGRSFRIHPQDYEEWRERRQPPGTLSLQEAAQRANLDMQALYGLLKRGGVDFVRVEGTARRVDEASLERWLVDRNRRQSGDYYTVEAAARLAGLSPSMVTRAVRQGELPADTSTGRTWIEAREFNRWLRDLHERHGPAPPDDQPWLTMLEAAQYSGKPAQALRNAAAKGTLQCRRVLQRGVWKYLVSRSELERWLREQHKRAPDRRDEEHLTVPEVASLAGLTASAVTALVRRGVLPAGRAPARGPAALVIPREAAEQLARSRSRDGRLSVKQMHLLTNLPGRVLREAVLAGELPGVEHEDAGGRGWLVEVQDFRDWLRERRGFSPLPFLTLKEAMQEVGVTLKPLQAALARGLIHSVKMPWRGDFLYLMVRESFERWWEKRQAR